MAIYKEILYILMVFATARSSIIEETRVSLKLFYESDCPDCRLFMEKQLGPLYNEDRGGTYKELGRKGTL